MEYIAIDQYGGHMKLYTKHPRKELMEQNYAKSARKLYRDKKDGSTVCTGYVVRGMWYTLFKVTPFEATA